MDPSPPLKNLPISVYDVRTDDGWKQIVACAPTSVGFKQGLLPKAILGQLLRPLEDGEPITPSVFARNRAFVDFVHDVIRRYAPTLPSFLSQAAASGGGFVYVIDQRTPTPGGAVPPEDIVGAFEIRGGNVVPDSYQPNPNHRILSLNGFLNLGPDLNAHLLAELANLYAQDPAKSKSDPA